MNQNLRSLLKHEQDEFYTVLQQAATQQYRTAALPPQEETLFSETQRDIFDQFVHGARLQNVSFSEQVRECMKAVQSLPVVTITLAFTPRIHYLHELLDQLSEYIKRPIVLVYQVDPSIMAGVVCEYDGKVGDFSFAAPFVNSFPSQI